MKKLLALLTITGVLTLGVSHHINAQGEETFDTVTMQDMTTYVVNSSGDTVSTETTPGELEPEEEAPAEMMTDEAIQEVEPSFHQIIKQKFIEGGAGFMSIVLICLILGLALAIERIIYLSLATTDTEKLNSGGVEAAKEVCRSTKGPVASIFYQGLDRAQEGIEIVEKSIVSYGSVQMGLLEKGLSWISLFISLAPMLGFMGTVIGMIGAFDAIEEAGDISPSLVAGGIKIALLTTVFGLIVAIILQIFYNYIVAKVDSLVNSMEDASISLIDILVKKEISKQ